MNQPIAPAPTFDPQVIGPRCLVTGGAGYVGRSLIARLRATGCQVRSLDVMPHQQPEGVEVAVGDLRNYDAVRSACEGIDTVFHVAALIKLLTICRPSVRKLAFDVNVGGTQNLLRAAKDAGVKTLVHTSSFNVVLDGDAVNKDETLPYADGAKDLYGQTKIAAERSTLAADTPGGMRVCAVRPGGIWGNDCGSLMIRSFLDELAAGNFKALIGNPQSVMDNTHVENLVDAQLLAAQALRTRPEVAGGQAYFIMDEESMNGMLWFRPLAEQLGYPFPKTWIPTALMRGVAWSMEVAHMFGAPEPKLTIRGVRNLSESSSLRIDKARRQLGYEPRYKLMTALPLLLPQARAYVEAHKKQKKALGVNAA